MLANYKIVRVSTDEKPTLKCGEMFIDNEKRILYVGVGDFKANTCEKEEEE